MSWELHHRQRDVSETCGHGQNLRDYRRWAADGRAENMERTYSRENKTESLMGLVHYNKQTNNQKVLIFESHQKVSPYHQPIENSRTTAVGYARSVWEG